MHKGTLSRRVFDSWHHQFVVASQASYDIEGSRPQRSSRYTKRKYMPMCSETAGSDVQASSASVCCGRNIMHILVIPVCYCY